jgi:hypothetical protein
MFRKFLGKKALRKVWRKIQPAVFGKITLGHLKILSRRVCQGFQRTCHDVKGSGEAKKTVFGT